jgi:hypothetical protein
MAADAGIVTATIQQTLSPPSVTKPVGHDCCFIIAGKMRRVLEFARLVTDFALCIRFPQAVNRPLCGSGKCASASEALAPGFSAVKKTRRVS